ncbi:transcription elongation factor GreA [Candidatus Dojkabacteria bacterium CG_4_10_14_3_um_filter_Dojkabacteria_WS6_41_9]|uniref:Transcription elongation factor GreA n=1 Tax=Candidatus Dojkabacteria bacterium CG_4_10_14_0_2_um_filter_Dojkabacteria_WS6_41_15 TaxID=2014249 RepID=A0A2M7W2U2_9BACT|nr:MAG: transcription elongation factor GreA [Candidatus Dojkabacteria bacterium CG_4_10_14_3_um_filter_Dojkabacteria_WS6_41_9]PJA15276.1 MAG: transcription elongation factor GreA [Candidatus Dojkabacteria bacterium CG_4_10_14_0_2_um_filter_Dojkabacteria_WS6_41_15]
MADIFLTKDGFKAIELELKDLLKNSLPEIKKRMTNAREDGDLSENNAWITAKEEMEIARMRVTELRSLMKTALLVEESGKKTDTIRLGDEVTLKMNGNTMKVKIVPTMEADPTANKLSGESPVGKAVMGKKIGEMVTITTPSGTQAAEIISKG